jgi:hypothetical protein
MEYEMFIENLLSYFFNGTGQGKDISREVAQACKGVGR